MSQEDPQRSGICVCGRHDTHAIHPEPYPTYRHSRHPRGDGNGEPFRHTDYGDRKMERMGAMRCESVFDEDENYGPRNDFHECQLDAGHIAAGVSLEHKCHCGVMWFNGHQVDPSDPRYNPT